MGIMCVCGRWGEEVWYGSDCNAYMGGVKRENIC